MHVLARVEGNDQNRRSNEMSCIALYEKNLEVINFIDVISADATSLLRLL